MSLEPLQLIHKIQNFQYHLNRLSVSNKETSIQKYPEILNEIKVFFKKRKKKCIINLDLLPSELPIPRNLSVLKRFSLLKAFSLKEMNNGTEENQLENIQHQLSKIVQLLNEYEFSNQR